MTRDGQEVVEINPRLGGGLIGEAICRSLGTNIYQAFLELAVGKRPLLMDCPLEVQSAHAEVDLYATRIGRFSGIEGAGMLPLHPGSPQLFQSKDPGTQIASIDDHRGGVGSVFASGETSELAMQNALAAAAKLHVVIERSMDPQ